MDIPLAKTVHTLTQRPEMIAGNGSFDREEALRLIWLSRIRWAVTIAYAVVALVVLSILQVRLPFTPFVAALVLTAVSNLLLTRSSAGLRSRLTAISGVTLCFDILVLGGLLYFCGGYTNPFSMMFLVYVIIAGFLLDTLWTWSIFVLSSAVFLALFFFHIPIDELAIHHGDGHASGFSLHLHGMFIAFFVIGSLLSFFLTRMSSALHEQREYVRSLQRERAQEEKLVALAQLTAGAAHELASPIGTLALVVDDMNNALRNDQRWGNDVALLRSEIDRCTAILHEMRGRSNELPGELPGAFTLRELFSELRSYEQLTITAGISRDSQIVCLKRSLIRSLDSMIKNAIQASPPGALVVLSVSSNSGYIEFAVTDNGSGIDPNILKRIGEPFFTTKPPGAGMGLGMFLTRLFAYRVGGTLSFESIIQKGTKAILRIPQSVQV